MKKEADTGTKKSICAEIQPLLFDYMSRELGPGRSDLVREHLRKCPDCQAEAAGMQAAMDVLRAAPRWEPEAPAHLSRWHRAKIIWSVAHPVLDWVIVHHILFSILTVAALILAILLLIFRMQMGVQTDTLPHEETIYSIRLSVPPAPQALHEAPHVPVADERPKELPAEEAQP